MIIPQLGTKAKSVVQLKDTMKKVNQDGAGMELFPTTTSSFFAVGGDGTRTESQWRRFDAKYRKVLARYATQVLKMDADLATDAVQELMIGLWKAPRLTYRPRSTTLTTARSPDATASTTRPSHAPSPRSSRTSRANATPSWPTSSRYDRRADRRRVAFGGMPSGTGTFRGGVPGHSGWLSVPRGRSQGPHGRLQGLTADVPTRGSFRCRADDSRLSASASRAQHCRRTALLRDGIRPARIGTEPFQAPEVADGKISEQSEIYSLGVTTRVLAKKSASLFRLALAIIPAKAKQPRKRFRSFEAFAAAVEHLEAAARHPDFDALGCQHERVYRILAECYRDGKGVAPDPAKSQYYRFKGR